MAIIKPNEMDFSSKKFSLIISGSPGVGKTTLALSAPNPILIDFDRGVSRVQAKHRKLTISAATYEEVLKDMESNEVKQAETIIIDTGGSFTTYLQDWAMRSNPAANKQKNANVISQKGFGAVKAEFQRFTNHLQYVMQKNIIYIFHTVEEKKDDILVQRLMCEGSARNIVWQPCDLGCYLYMYGNERIAGFSPTDQYNAKGTHGIKGIKNVPTLENDADNNYLTKLFESAKEYIAEESKYFEAENEEYKKAIAEGELIVKAVIDADSALKATDSMSQIAHALTSKKEIRAMFVKKIKDIGLKFDKAANAYVSI